jgi:N-acetylglucosamine-6-phosphate deacetylase
MKYLLYTLTFLLVMNASNSQQILEGLLYLDHSPVHLEIADGIITDVIRTEDLPDEARNVYIAPGFIDNQVNGYMGVSFVNMGGELSDEGVKKITRALCKYGVTTYIPTLTTSDREMFLRNSALLARSMKDPEICGSIAGFHLEGPYINPVDGYRGAHPLKYVRPPDWEEFMSIYEASEGNILQVTLAPDTEGAMDFISRCSGMGIVVGIGHHNASTDQVTRAVDRGARIATHLGNGLANSIHRHRNPLWPQLADDRLMISIIGDGFHLLPEEIRVFYRVKGPGRTIITSDVSTLGGMPPGKYLNVMGDTLELTPEGALIYPAQQVLAGSASPITKGVGNVLKVTGCSLAEAVRMASTNPAELYGLRDRGEIRPGMRADLILFTLEDFKINILRTMVAGEVVYESGK